MATFPDIAPEFGATENSAPRVRRVQFGDGYVQRLGFGLNLDLKKWSLVWENLGDTDTQTIEAFLEARGGSEYFTWTPPDSTTSSKWICAEWSKTMVAAEINTIRATFEEVADL